MHEIQNGLNSKHQILNPKQIQNLKLKKNKASSFNFCALGI